MDYIITDPSTLSFQNNFADDMSLEQMQIISNLYAIQYTASLSLEDTNI